MAGESKAPRVDSDFWPGASQKPTGNYVPPNAENFVCTFDYLSPAQIPSLMGMGPHGKPMCPSSPSNYGSYFSGDRQEALERLIEQAGVRQDRIVTMEKAGLQNAVAMLCEDYDGEVKQLVVWDPHFLGELDRKAGTNWASVAVLAHELAHHLNNDTGQNPGRIPPHERREQELYADRYAGQKLRAFGVSKDNAVAVFHHLGAGGDTHPSADERVVMAGEGWEAGRAQTVEDVPPPDDRDYPGSRKRDFDPPPPPPPTPSYGNGLSDSVWHLSDDDTTSARCALSLFYPYGGVPWHGSVIPRAVTCWIWQQFRWFGSLGDSRPFVKAQETSFFYKINGGDNGERNENFGFYAAAAVCTTLRNRKRNKRCCYW